MDEPCNDLLDEFALDTGTAYLQHEDLFRRGETRNKQAQVDEFRGRLREEERACRTCHRYWGFVGYGFCCNSGEEAIYTAGNGWCPNYEARQGACIVFSEWEPLPEETEEAPAPRKKRKGGKKT